MDEKPMNTKTKQAGNSRIFKMFFPSIRNFMPLPLLRIENSMKGFP
jgi:hypothetical protein